MGAVLYFRSCTTTLRFKSEQNASIVFVRMAKNDVIQLTAVRLVEQRDWQVEN